MQTIKVEPTTGGYVRIAQVLAQDILSSTRKDRRDAVEVILKSLLDITRYLGTIGESDVPERILAKRADSAE